MSYYFHLRDPVTHEELRVPGHLMYGGNVVCEIDGQGRFIPTPTTGARLNITYNYARYYQEAFPPMEKVDESNRAQYLQDKETYGIRSDDGGVKSLNGMSGVDAVPLLEEMIRRIEAEYKKPDGTWVITERQRTYYTSRSSGKIVDSLLDVFYSIHSPDETEQETWARIREEYEEHVKTEAIDEGGRGRNYWTATAANAIRPLYQLIALSKLRPDGIWGEGAYF